MTRRMWLVAAASGWALASSGRPVVIPARLLVDSRNVTPDLMDRLWRPMWTEAVGDLARCGIQLPSTQGAGEIRRSPSGAPVFTGLIRGAINVVVTARMPTQWDNGRGLSGVTTSYEGCHLSVIALDQAHGHRVPFFSVNTCLHELLHVLMLDVFEKRPPGVTGEAREMRIDAYATQLWLLGDSEAIRNSARTYVARLKAMPSS